LGVVLLLARRLKDAGPGAAGDELLQLLASGNATHGVKNETPRLRRQGFK